MPRVARRRRRVPLVPLALVAQRGIGKHRRQAAAAHHERAIVASHGTPRDVRRPARHGAGVFGHKGNILALVEFQGVAVDAVGHGERVRVGGGVGVAVFVGHDVVAGGQLGDGCHAGAILVDGVLGIRDDGPPGQGIGGGLVHEALAVGGVEALVRVVDDKLVVMKPARESDCKTP